MRKQMAFLTAANSQWPRTCIRYQSWRSPINTSRCRLRRGLEVDGFSQRNQTILPQHVYRLSLGVQKAWIEVSILLGIPPLWGSNFVERCGVIRNPAGPSATFPPAMMATAEDRLSLLQEFQQQSMQNVFVLSPLLPPLDIEGPIEHTSNHLEPTT